MANGSKVGEIQKYLDLADRLDELDPKVSYQCRFYAMRKGCVLSRDSPGDTELRRSLGEQMTKLEQTKGQHGGEDGKDKVLTLATLTLKHSEADFENGIRTEDTFKNYLTVVNLLDVLRDNDGNLPPNFQQLQKTAKWKATEVLKEIKGQKAAAAPPPANGGNFDFPGGFPSTPSGNPGFPSTPSGAGGFPSTPSGAPEFPSTPSGAGGFPSTPGAGGFPSTPSGNPGFPSTPSGPGGFPSTPQYGAPPTQDPSGYNFPSTPSAGVGGFPSAPGGYPSNGYPAPNGAPPPAAQPQSFDSMFPSTPSSNNAHSPNHPNVPPGAYQVLPTPTPTPTPAPAPAPTPTPTPAPAPAFAQDFSTVTGKKGNASDRDIEMAMRLSKHAASALQYDDVPTAVQKLEQALALLKK